MVINREFYVDKLLKTSGNGLVKVITGIRRAGKSYLLFNLYRNLLRERGVDEAHLVSVQLDDDDFAELRLPRALSAWIRRVYRGTDCRHTSSLTRYRCASHRRKSGASRTA